MLHLRRVSLLTLASLLLCLTSVSIAKADVLTYSVTLSGSQEVPPNASPATGFATGTYDTVTNIITLNLSWSGLTGPAAAAHYHCCTPPGANAPVVQALTFFPAATSGTYSNSFVFSDANEAGLLAGLVYLNIHTGQFPGGEIRAQVFPLGPVPEPASLILLGTGIAGIGAALRKRRKATPGRDLRE